MSPIRRILAAVREPHARNFPDLTKAGQLTESSGARMDGFHCIDIQIPVGSLGRDGDTIASPHCDFRDTELNELERVADPPPAGASGETTSSPPTSTASTVSLSCCTRPIRNSYAKFRFLFYRLALARQTA